MSKEERRRIVDMSKRFAKAFQNTIGCINGSGWLIVDPLSGYLNSVGIDNTLSQLPESDKHPLILIMTFKDGSILIPAGEDLKPLFPEAKNWMWTK